MLKISTAPPWWQRLESYTKPDLMPPAFERVETGPKGVALVRAWESGKTSEGWGLVGRDGSPGFMPRYLKGEFEARRHTHGYPDSWNVALVMRSMNLVCLDIDGKNDGFNGARRLGSLPPTMAEVSKSGNGVHLFYTIEDTWDAALGFASLGDRIGIEQGVDFRGTGCVYHHPQQRWNDLAPVPLPKHLYTVLKKREQKQTQNTEALVKILKSNDPLEVLMLQEELIADLNRPIDEGKRNNTLFAIGTKMKTARVPDWEDLVMTRATQVGLGADEAGKLVRNINSYS